MHADTSIIFYFWNKGCGLPALNPNVDLHTINTRIMNGKEAVPHSWPYAISIAFEGPKGKNIEVCILWK